ncbi:ABC transporter ATP-binding protein [Paenibacillus anaericanus]|uniref:Carnitine transport ATP-binding protein OpuCA n=1 Tax=Paenibacillus anaericanus TaxID=170367 RepID=A0A433Y7C0_9BACL|nr:ABC transporter ATP-binding protein [Paenibacillus anaericanus]RUT45322.1 ABC transporter ATP-binding protein [Paenibacillus anaericanus]
MDLNIRGLGKSFGGTVALHPTDLTVRQGSFTTLLGPSGCGKTTILRMIAGLETPDMGTISMGEEVIFSGSAKRAVPTHQRGFGMVFQDFALWPHMTVFENVAFGLRAGKRTSKIRETVMEALDKVKLTGMAERFPHQLSGGQQQRVAFARAVAITPRLVLFDEPLSALDAVLREDMRVEMMSLVRDLGLTALYVTHDQIEAMSMSDEVVVMNSGCILQSGTPEEVYGKPTDAFVARFIGKSNWLVPEQTMFRPEHLLWEPTEEECHSYQVEITHVSYVGERYELRLKAEGHGEQWTAYHHTRQVVGTKTEVYLPHHRLHHLDESK